MPSAQRAVPTTSSSQPCRISRLIRTLSSSFADSSCFAILSELEQQVLDEPVVGDAEDVPGVHDEVFQSPIQAQPFARCQMLFPADDDHSHVADGSFAQASFHV